MDLIEAIKIVREKDGRLLEKAGEPGHIADVSAGDAQIVAQAWEVIASAAERASGRKELAEAMEKAKETEQAE